MAKGELDSLRGMLNRNPADPLEQTIFEKGPEVGFVTPAMPILTPQEGQTILPGVIASVDPGIAWDALGAQAFKLGGDLFEQTLDYLIESKGNSVRDLGDMYQSKLDTAYIRLSTEQKKAKAMKTDVDDTLVDGLLDEIETVKKEWRQKADEALETGQGNWYTPAINYWDENLDMKSMGTKYQQLAVAARAADRNIMDQAQKLLFEAQLNNRFEKKQKDSTAYAKQEATSFDKEIVNTKVLAGMLPLAAQNEVPTRRDGTKMFTNINVQTGQQEPIMVQGLPLTIVDDMGFSRFNPELASISPQVVFNAIDNPEDWDYYMQVEQDTTDSSAMYSKGGTLTPEYEGIVKDYFSRTPTTRSPMDMYKISAMFARLPPEAVATIAKNNNLSTTDKDIMLLGVDAAQRGLKIDEMSKLRLMSPEDVTEARKVLGVAMDSQLATAGGVMASGATTGETQILLNQVMTPMIGSILGLTPEQVKDLEVGRTQDGRIFDPTPGYNLYSLVSRNPALQTTMLKALAYFKANPLLLRNEKGKPRSEEEIATTVSRYMQTEASVAGQITFIDQRTGLPNTYLNKDMLWMGSYAKNPDELATLTMALPQSDLFPQSRNVVGDNMVEIDYKPGAAVFNNATNKVDRAVFAALYQNMTSVVEDNSGVQTSYKGLPQGEALRLSAASHPDTWTALKLWDGRTELSPEQREDLALQALDQILPATEWGMAVDLTGRYDAFAQTGNGGLAVGFRSIPTKNGTNLLPLLINQQRLSPDGYMFTPEKNGVPVLSIPARQPQSGNVSISEKIGQLKTKRNSKQPLYRVDVLDTAPATAVQPLTAIMSQVGTVTAAPELARAFSLVSDQTLQNSNQAYDFMNINQTTIAQVVKNNPQFANGVKIMVNDFDIADVKDRRFFTPANMSTLFEEAKKRGLTSSVDFVSFALAAAQTQAENKKPTSAKNPQRVEAIKQAFAGLNIPVNFDDNSFFVPNTGTDSGLNGLVMYNYGTQEFFDGLRKYSAEGYNVYVNKNDPSTYYLRRPEEGTDETVALVLPGKIPNEPEAEYTNKYNQVFGQREADVARAKGVKDRLKKTLTPQTAPPMLQAQVEKPMVLPSKMISDFTSALNKFTQKNKIGFYGTQEELSKSYDTMLFYDLTRLYYDTGSLDYTLDTLPPQYRLPGHSMHPQTIVPMSKGTGTGMQTFGEIGSGLQDAGMALIKMPFQIEASLNKAAGNTPARTDELGEAALGLAQDAFPTFATREHRIKKALESKDINVVFTELFDEPIAKLRMQDQEMTERLNQNSLNFIGLAFPLSTSPTQDYPKDTKITYGISKEAYDQAKLFADRGWSQVTFEHQIRAATAQLPKKTGAVDVDTVIKQLDPTKFIMDDRFKAQFRKDLLASMPKEPLPGRSQAESNRQREADMKAVLEDSTILVGLKRDYLDMMLNPPTRTTTTSSNRTKEQALQQKFWQAIPEAKKDIVAFMLDSSNMGSIKTRNGVDFELVAEKSPAEFYKDIYGEELSKELITEAMQNQESFMVASSSNKENILSKFAKIPQYASYKDEPIKVYRLDKKYGEEGKDITAYAFASKNRNTGEVGIYLGLKLKPEDTPTTVLHEGIHGMQFKETEESFGLNPSNEMKFLAGTKSPQKVNTKAMSYVLDPLEVSAWVAGTKAEYYRETGKVIRPNGSDADYNNYFDWLQSAATNNKMKNGPIYQVLHDAFRSKNKDIRDLMRETARQVADVSKVNNNTRLI